MREIFILYYERERQLTLVMRSRIRPPNLEVSFSLFF
nr:MAG TPA: hypothetical protein [Caudoviricetes sp.]